MDSFSEKLHWKYINLCTGKWRVIIAWLQWVCMRTHLWEKTAVEGRTCLNPPGTVRSVHRIRKRLMTLCPRFAGDMARLSRLEDLGNKALQATS